MEEYEQNTQSDIKKASISLALASGGIRSLACVPLFNFLREKNIKIDCIYGSSGGALMACLYSLGLSGEEIKEFSTRVWQKKLFKHYDYRALLGVVNLPFGIKDNKSALLKSKNFIKILEDYFGDKRLEDLPIPVHVHTTDFRTGEDVILTKGLISSAVYASSASFPFLPPLEIDGKLLVDGAFSAPLPILQALEGKSDLIIGVMYDMYDAEPKGLLESFYAFMGRLLNRLRQSQLGFGIDMYPAEVVLIRVKCKGMLAMWNVDKIPDIIEAAQQEVDSKKGEIMYVIDSLNELNRRKS